MFLDYTTGYILGEIMAYYCLNYLLGCILHGHSSVSNSVDCHRIMNAVQTSGVLRKTLFNAAYNSKKQVIISGMCIDI